MLNMKIKLGLDYLNERASERKLVEAEGFFQALAGTGLSHKQLGEVLPYIQDHKWYVSERLGRDVGMRVAAVDYIENVYRPVKEDSRPQAISHHLIGLAKKAADLYLTHLCWQAHEGVFPSPSENRLPSNSN
jgi:hypothetical protein